MTDAVSMLNEVRLILAKSSMRWGNEVQAWWEIIEYRWEFLSFDFFPVSSNFYNGFAIDVSTPPPNCPIMMSSAIQDYRRPTAAVAGFYGRPSRLPANPNLAMNQTVSSYASSHANIGNARYGTEGSSYRTKDRIETQLLHC